MTWVWILSSLCSTCVAMSLGEICSTYQGSVYFWTGQLASPEWAPFLSFLCGWLNLAAWVLGGSAYAGNLVRMTVTSPFYTR